MPDDQDDSQKTEDPTQKRLDDAFKKGQVPNSREVTSFMMLLIFALSLIWLSPQIMKKASFNIVKYIEQPHQYHLDSQSIIVISSDILSDVLFLMVAPVSMLILAIFFSSLIQHRMLFAPDAFMPKLERISLLKGLKRIFGLRNFVEFIKGIIKIIMIGAVCYLAVSPHLTDIMNLPSQSILAMLLLLGKLTTRIMIGVCSLMLIIAVADFLYQKFEYIKSLRMSKKDIKDEFKQTEGSPEVKAKLREIRNKRANERMMTAVPDSDVVITNPTHYSIALKYNEKMHEAPVVVAKGMDFIALKIREVAKENNVPIVENPPLARALYASVELEQEIPLEHYNAVAEVIKYVYQLKGKK